MSEQEKFEAFFKREFGQRYACLDSSLDMRNGEYIEGDVSELWEVWQAATAQAVPEGYVAVPTTNVNTFYQDDDEPENFCNNESEFDLLGDCLDDSDIMVVNKITLAELANEKFYGTWVVDASNRKFELFVSYAEAAQAIKALKAESLERNGK